MSAPSRQSWHPDRRWADSLIALLALLALLVAGLTLSARQRSARRPSERASLQGRLMEVALGGPALLLHQDGPSRDWTRAERQAREPWDRALLAVLRAELGEQKEPTGHWLDGITPAGAGGPGFRRVCLAAYAGAPLPSSADRTEIHRRLGNGYAADLLEARLRDRESGGEALRAQARRTLTTRLAGLAAMGLLVVGAAVGGLVLLIYLLATRPLPQPLPAWSLSGRAAALVLLTWFLGFFLASNLAGLLLAPWPGLRWLAIPLGYTLHAALGVRLLCWAEGLSLRELWQRVAPGRPGRDLAWGGAFLGLAVLLVLAVALVAGPLLSPDQSPQRDLQELLRSLRGWLPNLALFLTVTLLAPCFEELLFRGFLLPVLARKQRLALALALSALLFGAIHLQPAGLPTLSTLGLVMGLALRHTGSLRTPILIHACWNGSQFLLLRAFA
ncbi:MAG: CPBP family intramembrane metalloprotease [Holophagaceae bacterium]|nr:CPBP family intramembrane metalloprotease [Holophagaceae bacterium]